MWGELLACWDVDYGSVTDELSVRQDLMPRILDICRLSLSTGRICKEVILEMKVMW